jgi:hypothetical protein
VDGLFYVFLTDGTCVSHEWLKNVTSPARIYPDKLWPGIDQFYKNMVAAFTDKTNSYFLTDDGTLHAYSEPDRKAVGTETLDAFFPGLLAYKDKIKAVLDWSTIDGSIYVLLDNGTTVRADMANAQKAPHVSPVIAMGDRRPRHGCRAMGGLAPTGVFHFSANASGARLLRTIL